MDLLAAIRWPRSMAHLFVIFTAVCSLVRWEFVSADRIREKIYHNFDTHAFCMRRLNGTHEVGCSSSPSGDVGVLHFLQTAEDVQYVTSEGSHPPYIAIIDSLNLNFYNVKTLKSLQNSNRVRGVILIKYDNETLTESFSGDKICPNENYGMYGENEGGSCGGIPWNAEGNGMLFERWNFPIFMLYQNSDIDYLLNNCTFRFNQPRGNETLPSWPLCSAELMSYMLAAADSQTCIRRSNTITNLSPQTRCDPLADFNVWASLTPVNKSASLPSNSTIIVAARLDAGSVFEFVPGVESSVSGVVTLMLVAETLKKVQKDFSSKNILFLFFNGETFDYVGSSRVVYDIQRGHFPQEMDDSAHSQNALLRLENVEFFVELSQLAILKNETFFFHTDPFSTQDVRVRQKVAAFGEMAEEEGRKMKMKTVLLNGTELPPASFQRFLKSGVNIPGVVIADHERQYHNRFYNSEFDDLKNQNNSYPKNMSDADAFSYPSLMAVNLQKVATIVARTIYKSVTGNDLPHEASLNTSANLLYCYAYKSNCSLFASYFNGTSNQYLKNTSLEFYIGANRRTDAPQLTAFVTSRVLANLIGERVDINETDCKPKEGDQLYNYMFYYTSLANGTREGYCVKSGVFWSPAKSPAFLLDDYSGNYSTWTESVWATTTMRIFLKADPQEDVNTLAFGLVVTILVTALIFGMSRAANDIFLASEDV